MVKAGKTVGRIMRKIVMSPTWKAVQQTSRDLRNLPNRLIREAGLEEELKDIRKAQEDLRREMEEIQQGERADPALPLTNRIAKPVRLAAG